MIGPRRPPLRREQAVLGMFFVGLMVLGSSAFFLRDAVRLIRRGEHGSGVIVRIETRRHRGRRGGRHQVAIVRLTGQSSTGECELRARAGDAVGVSLPMVFLPDQPEVCGVDRLPRLVGMPGLGFAGGAFLVIASLAAYERERRKARSSL